MLVNYAPLILILGGVTAVSWLIGRLAKLTSLLGFFVGVLLLATAAAVWSAEVPRFDTGTQYLLIVMGLALFLRPIRNIPWAAMMGLMVGGLCAGLVFLFYPLPETVYGVSSTWVYLLIFLIPALLIYFLFKFIEDVLKLVGLILASKPVALILGLVCIIQGVLLLLDRDLFFIFFY